MQSDDRVLLKLALQKAHESVDQGGFPAGAIVVKNERVVGEGVSLGNLLHDPSAHGEMSAIRQACLTLKTTDLGGAVLYASMAPCVMCLSAAMWSGISRIVYACRQEKVSPEYYGGHYMMDLMNAKFLRPMILEHCADLEEDSLGIVQMWEDALG